MVVHRKLRLKLQAIQEGEVMAVVHRGPKQAIQELWAAVAAATWEPELAIQGQGWWDFVPLLVRMWSLARLLPMEAIAVQNRVPVRGGVVFKEVEDP